MDNSHVIAEENQLELDAGGMLSKDELLHLSPGVFNSPTSTSNGKLSNN
jgi:hypothetical protein